jgi:predicted acyl esterase
MAPPALRFMTASSVQDAKASFEAQDPRVRVLFDNGGGDLGAGALQPTFEASATSWPPRGALTRWYLGSGGTLSSSRGTGNPVSFRPDPSVRPATDLPSGNAWAAQPPYRWTAVPAANGIAFETPVFGRDTTIVGPASLDLWLKSTAPSTDLQATVTEVRPGSAEEEYVTSGFLRTDNRALTSSSTALDPVPTYRGRDRQSLPSGRYTLVRIPIDPIAHAFRAGTRLRVVISAPGGDRPSWAFDTVTTHGSVTDTVALSGAHASSLAVNVVSGVVPTAALPACGALRGEPCRPYAVLGNQR